MVNVDIVIPVLNEQEALPVCIAISSELPDCEPYKIRIERGSDMIKPQTC